jgi:hypothetical protein
VAATTVNATPSASCRNLILHHAQLGREDVPEDRCWHACLPEREVVRTAADDVGEDSCGRRAPWWLVGNRDLVVDLITDERKDRRR